MSNEKRYGLLAAGSITIILIWSVIQPDSAPFLGMNRSLVVHFCLGTIFLAFLLSDQIGHLLGRYAAIVLQLMATVVIMAAAPGSAGPILSIVVVAQLAFNAPLAALWTAVACIQFYQVTIFVLVWQYTLSTAVINSLLYGTFHVFAILVARYAIQAEQAKMELAEVNAELLATRSLLIETARDRERLRVSRELHDVAGHTLTALKLNLRALTQSTTGEARETAQESLDLSDQLLDDVRALVSTLREHDGLDVTAAIRELTAPFDQPHFAYDLDPDCQIEDISIARLVLSVTREAVTNVARHARASLCEISLNARADTAGGVLTISDDGVGIKQAVAGNGLTGMEERAHEAGAQLTISPGQPTGTVVSLTWGRS